MRGLRSSACYAASGYNGLGLLARTPLRGDFRVNLRVFYYFERGDDQVTSTSPLSMSRDAVRTRLIPQLEGEDDYIGLVDEEENTLQIMLVADRAAYWIELPMSDQHASYGKVVSLDELVEILQLLPRRFRPRDFSDFQLRAWGTGLG